MPHAGQFQVPVGTGSRPVCNDSTTPNHSADVVRASAVSQIRCRVRALDGGEAKATEAVALDELVQVDEQQLEHDAQVAAEVEVAVHAHDVPAPIRILHFACA